MSVAGDDQRIDFAKRAIVIGKESADRRHELHRRFGGGSGDVQSLAQFANLVRFQSDGRVEVLLEDFFRRFFGDLFDLDAAFGAGHQHRHRRGPIQHDTQIQFARDVATGFDKHLVDNFALVAGLNRHQRLAQQSFRGRPHVVGRLANDDAALIGVFFGGSFAATAGVNLGFDDGDLSAQFLVRLNGLISRLGDVAFKNRDAGGTK